MKWTTYKYRNGITISVMYNNILDGDWEFGDQDEVIIEINSSFYENKW